MTMMTRRQLLATLALTASGARLVRGAQKADSESAPRTVTLLIEGMT